MAINSQWARISKLVQMSEESLKDGLPPKLTISDITRLQTNQLKIKNPPILLKMLRSIHGEIIDSRNNKSMTYSDRHGPTYLEDVPPNQAHYFKCLKPSLPANKERKTYHFPKLTTCNSISSPPQKKLSYEDYFIDRNDFVLWFKNSDETASDLLQIWIDGGIKPGRRSTKIEKCQHIKLIVNAIKYYCSQNDIQFDAMQMPRPKDRGLDPIGFVQLYQECSPSHLWLTTKSIERYKKGICKFQRTGSLTGIYGQALDFVKKEINKTHPL